MSNWQTRLTDLPIKDPIQYQQARLLQNFLIILLVGLVLAVVYNLIALGAQAFMVDRLGANVVMLLGVAGTLAILRRGYVTAAVMLVSTAIMVVLGFQILNNNLQQDSVLLVGFVVPITMVGLVAGGKSLLAIIGLSYLVVGGIALVQHSGTLVERLLLPGAGTTRSVVVIFFLTIAAFGLFLDQFSHVLRDALVKQQRHEESLRAANERLQAIVQASPIGIILLDQAGRITLWSPAAEQIFGWKQTQVLGKALPTIPPDQQLEATALHRRVLNGESVTRQVLTRQRQNGSSLDVSLSLAPLHDSQGQATGILALVTDITERRRAEAALRESEARFRVALSNSPITVFTHDHDLRYTWIYNPVGNFTPEGLLGKTDREMVPEAEANQLMAIKRRVIETGVGERNEVTLTMAGEARTFDFVAEPLYDTQGQITGVTCAAIDITERKQAELQRQQLITELEARNAEMERFTYTVSHDLKSPLITIRGFVGMLESDIPAGNTANVQTDLAYIKDATTKMQMLLDDLLELSRVGRLVNPSSAVSLREVVAQALVMVAGQIAARQVTVEVAPNLPIVYADAPRMLEVFQNLIDNAVKFMGDQPDPRIKIGVRCDGDLLVCFVQDNGVGIDPPYQQKVFGLFEQLDNTIEGTGIGLALVKRIIEVHDGRIWVESDGAGRGSTFCFTIPTMTLDEDV
ncbi:MAG: PAS domain S-box protein [Anaerolineae bacterium]|nr:PAS domain S-box protein [Anaerolineae bacterium]